MQFTIFAFFSFTNKSITLELLSFKTTILICYKNIFISQE